MSTLRVERTAPGRLRVDVPSEFAEKARVYTPEQRMAFALLVAQAATLDVWEVIWQRQKRGVSNRGFVAGLMTVPE